MGTLQGKRALVTGGGQGIGFAIVEELIRQGADVAIHYYSSSEGARKLVESARAAGVRASAFQADLSKEAEAKRIVADAVAFLGGLDVLVNNAGDLVERRPLAEADEAHLRRVMGINLDSMHFVTRAASPALAAAGGASIVNLSSLAGRKGGNPGSLLYATAKGAVLTFTRALASELGPKGVRVNSVAPGLILGTRFHATHSTPAGIEAMRAGIPLGRAGTPSDVARVVAFLASEYDGFITGATLDVNGGVYSA